MLKLSANNSHRYQPYEMPINQNNFSTDQSNISILIENQMLKLRLEQEQKFYNLYRRLDHHDDAMERITQLLTCAPGQEITNQSTRAEYNHKRNQRRRWRKRKNGWITFEYNHQFPHPEIGGTEY